MFVYLVYYWTLFDAVLDVAYINLAQYGRFPNRNNMDLAGN